MMHPLSDQPLIHLAITSSDADAWGEPFGPTGLVLRLLTPAAEGTAFLSTAAFTASGLSREEWVSRSTKALQVATPAGVLQLIDTEAGVWGSKVGDGHDAARAVFVETLLTESAPFGVFVSVPHRDSLLVLPLTVAALENKALVALKALSDAQYADAAHPLSPDLFWVRDGVWYRFEMTVIPDGPVSMRPPPELAETVMRMMGQPKAE